MLSRWSGSFQVAAVYVGTIVGAGFATGKEILEFFTQYGFYGFLGILIAGYIFIFTGTKMMLLSSRAGAATYEDFNRYLFGKRIAAIVNVIFLLMLLGVSSVMISGAGAVFEEQLGFSKDTGILITIGLASVILALGMKGLFAVNSFVVPVMVFFSLMLCFISIKGGGFLESFVKLPEEGLTWKALISPFAYAAFNLGLSQAVLVPVANEIGDEKIIKNGGILGGVFLTAILLSGHLALVSLPDASIYEIPSAELMRSGASSFYWIFILVIYGEIFTSVIGNIFGLQRQISHTFANIPGTVIVFFIFMITYIISKIEYGSLLSYLYPLFGYICMIFLFLVWKKK
ncbi:hypothetical protein ELQ35_07875 [Peribacillus cavernae]|uniref:Transporter n=1 Tax=Peribacillus cavernae TaxID=1674310 RepID=A0A433HPK0_9BACI|nr:hypothetical protein [Peribacillus cavernae]MDQ0217287.1 putative membrane protein YkvI [Peribacillus cavernae]RUQ30247.1 hypothetical protein ELQ35_07875 [Peribacillus cavernae]